MVRTLRASTGETPAKLSLLKLEKPPKYDAKTLGKHRAWERAMERHFRVLQVQQTMTVELKIHYAATLLEGDNASAWERYLENNHNQPMTTWGEYKVWLKGRIESATHSEWTANLRFNELKQLPNQSVSSFMTTFNDLRAEAAPEFQGETFWVKNFFTRLRPELRAKILDWPNMPATLVDLEAQATRLEHALSLNKPKVQTFMPSLTSERQNISGGTNSSYTAKQSNTKHKLGEDLANVPHWQSRKVGEKRTR